MYNRAMDTTQASSIRLTVEAKSLLRALATQSGISMTAVLEIIIREHAQRKGVQ